MFSHPSPFRRNAVEAKLLRMSQVGAVGEGLAPVEGGSTGSLRRTRSSLERFRSLQVEQEELRVQDSDGPGYAGQVTTVCQ